MTNIRNPYDFIAYPIPERNKLLFLNKVECWAGAFDFGYESYDNGMWLGKKCAGVGSWHDRIFYISAGKHSSIKGHKK